MAHNALKEPFRIIIRKLNSMSEYTTATILIKSYQQLVTLTQDNSSWTKILQLETARLETSYPKLYDQLQQLYKKNPLKPTITIPPQIIYPTLFQALKRKLVDYHREPLQQLENEQAKQKDLVVLDKLP